MFSVVVPLRKDVAQKEGSGKFYIEGAASVAVVDREKELITEDALKKVAQLLAGRPILKNHSGKVDDTVGVIEKAWFEDGKLMIRAYISETEEKLRKKIQEGIIRSLSIGGDVLNTEFDEEKDITRITDLDIYEVSLTPIPANPHATIVRYIAKSLKLADVTAPTSLPSLSSPQVPSISASDQEAHSHTVQKEVSKTAKVSWAEWEAPSDKERENLPDSYFLLPSEKKFPYKEWKGANKGAINCNALRAAIARAAQHGYPQVKEKAQRLYDSNCKKEEKEMAEEEVKKEEVPQEAPVEEKKEKPVEEKKDTLEPLVKELQEKIEALQKEIEELKAEKSVEEDEPERVSVVKSTETKVKKSLEEAIAELLLK